MVRGLIIRGSGTNLETMDAGVFVEQSAADAIVEGNRLEGNLYGIYLHGAPNAIARDNQIIGIREGRVNEAGNGVSVSNAPGPKCSTTTSASAVTAFSSSPARTTFLRTFIPRPAVRNPLHVHQRQ